MLLCPTTTVIPVTEGIGKPWVIVTKSDRRDPLIGRKPNTLMFRHPTRIRHTNQVKSARMKKYV